MESFPKNPTGNQVDQREKLSQQERFRDSLVETVSSKPWTYISLRSSIDRGLLTREHAQAILIAWEKAVEKEEETYLESEMARIMDQDKEMPSNRPGYVYPKRYAVKAIEEQFDALREVLGLYVNESVDLPAFDTFCKDSRYESLSSEVQPRSEREGLEGENGELYPVDGVFYIPPIYTVADAARKYYPEEVREKPDDEVALWYVLKCLSKVRAGTSQNFVNHLEGIDPRYLRLHPRAAWAHAKNELESGMGRTFWPIQTGEARIETVSRSLSSIRKASESRSFVEVPIDLYSIVCLILSHPERVGDRESDSDLFILPIGSQYSEKANGAFDLLIPMLWWDDGKLELRIYYTGFLDNYVGNVTGFIPR